MTSFIRVVKNNALLLLAVALVAMFINGIAFFTQSHASTTAAPMAMPQAIPVGAVTVGLQSTRVWSAFSGRVQAVDYAEIRPEVSGRVTEIRLKDGENVKAGDILLVIDPQPYQAALDKARANLAAAHTKERFAQKELDRARKMVKLHAIAQRVFDERSDDNNVAKSDIEVARANLKQAHIDLDHAYVKAPISGRVSRAEITLGNLVQSGPNAPILTTIVSNDGVYADFEVDEQTYMKSIRAHAATQDMEQAIPVELTVQGDEGHPYKGTIYSFDNHIDGGSGTIRARAKFANEDGHLMPGMFVSVKLASSGDENVLMIPERAIANDQSKKYVYVVGNDNKVVYREITLGQQVEGKQIVLSGLQPGEKVIVDGLQHVGPSVLVQVEPAAIESTDPKKIAVN